MDPIPAIYPPTDSCNPHDQETSTVPNSQPINSARPAAATPATTFPSPNDAPSSRTSDLDLSHQRRSSPPLYSPTRAEIEAHPIRQRLSTTRDDFAATWGNAREDPHTFHQFDRSASEQRQAQEEELESSVPDAMADTSTTGEQQGSTLGNLTEKAKGIGSSILGGGGKPATESEKPADVAHNTSNDAMPEQKATEDPVAKLSGDKPAEPAVDKSLPSEPVAEKSGEPQTGEKRPAEDVAEGDAAKLQKTDAEPKENGEAAAPKKKGRPAKNGGGLTSTIKKEIKKRAPKKAATETGEPRRSGRLSKSD